MKAMAGGGWRHSELRNNVMPSVWDAFWLLLRGTRWSHQINLRNNQRKSNVNPIFMRCDGDLDVMAREKVWTSGTRRGSHFSRNGFCPHRPLFKPPWMWRIGGSAACGECSTGRWAQFVFRFKYNWPPWNNTNNFSDLLEYKWQTLPAWNNVLCSNWNGLVEETGVGSQNLLLAFLSITWHNPIFSAEKETL